MYSEAELSMDKKMSKWPLIIQFTICFTIAMQPANANANANFNMYDQIAINTQLAQSGRSQTQYLQESQNSQHSMDFNKSNHQ